MSELINATAQTSPREPWNKGIVRREAAAPTQARVVDPRQTANGGANTRLSHVQLGY